MNEITSPMRLTPRVSATIIRAGATVAHTLSDRIGRFSEIISPQFAAGGFRPRPRKFTAATSSTAAVKQSPKFARTGASMFGRISRRRIAVVRSPRTTAASRTSVPPPGVWRVHDPDNPRCLHDRYADDEYQLAVAEARRHKDEEQQRWKGQNHIDRPHDHRIG